MRSFATLSALTVLASLVTAIPHSRNLGHHRFHSRSLDLSSLVARSIYDGKCGGDAGPCGEGYCCSQWGYCGKTDDYCGAGCQSGFGTCGNNDTSHAAPAPVASSTTVVLSSVSMVPNKNSYPTQFGHGPVSAPTAAASPYTGPLQSTFSAAAPSQIYSAPSSSSQPVPTSDPSASSGGSGYGNVYKLYSGNGESGWPSQSEWASFDSMWTANLPVMKGSCAAWNVPDNSDEENDEVKSAIQSIASSSGVDERFILAIIMQESQGCVRVITTVGSVANPGLMQSHQGTGTCNTQAGVVSTPCPGSEITQMIKDGTEGTATGDGLQQLLSAQGGNFYKAARCYNSGSIDPSGNLDAGVATHCYASDIANRLTGWTTGATQCHLNG